MSVVDLMIGFVALVIGLAFGALWMRPQIASARGEVQAANAALGEARVGASRLEADLERHRSELENSRQGQAESEQRLAVTTARYEAEAAGVRQELKNTFSELAQGALNQSAATLVDLAKQKLNVEVESAKNVVAPIAQSRKSQPSSAAESMCGGPLQATNLARPLHGPCSDQTIKWSPPKEVLPGLPSRELSRAILRGYDAP